MRTTLTVDDHLLAEAKQVAARSGRSVSGVVEDALRQALGQRPATGAADRVTLPTARGDGFPAGLDLSRNADVRAFMEGEQRPSPES